MEVNQQPIRHIIKPETLVHKCTATIVPGVVCHAYAIKECKDTDFALIEMQPGSKTNWQKQNKDQGHTMEFFVSGSGILRVIRELSDKSEIYVFENGECRYNGQLVDIVGVGISDFDWIQWEATGTGLVFGEMCSCPFQEGRFTDYPPNMQDS